MKKIFPALLIMMILSIVTTIPANARPDSNASPASPDEIIAACEQKHGEDRIRIHHCLLDSFNQLEKEVEQLNDKLLGLIGSHRAFGRLKIIQWSNAVAKSHYYWQKMLPWDCEWEGHVLPTSRGAAVAIDRCGIREAAERVKLMKKRISEVERITGKGQNQP